MKDTIIIIITRSELASLAPSFRGHNFVQNTRATTYDCTRTYAHAHIHSSHQATPPIDIEGCGLRETNVAATCILLRSIRVGQVDLAENGNENERGNEIRKRKRKRKLHLLLLATSTHACAYVAACLKLASALALLTGLGCCTRTLQMTNPMLGRVTIKPFRTPSTLSV